MDWSQSEVFLVLLEFKNACEMIICFFGIMFTCIIVYVIIILYCCGRFDDKNEAGSQRPSKSADQSRDAVASDLFADPIYGADDDNWLDMASGPGSKKSCQAKSTLDDRPHSEGSVADKPRQSNNSCLLIFSY